MNAEQPDYRETIHIKMPIWSFAVGVVLTSLVFVAFAWQGWRLQRQFEDVSQFSIEATRAASGLQYLDSAMTVSAFMATHSKGTDWRKRHARHAKELDVMLSRARDSAPDRSTACRRNLAANAKLPGCWPRHAIAVVETTIARFVTTPSRSTQTIVLSRHAWVATFPAWRAA